MLNDKELFYELARNKENMEMKNRKKKAHCVQHKKDNLSGRRLKRG